MAEKDIADPFFPADPFGLTQTPDGGYQVEAVQDLPQMTEADSYRLPQPAQTLQSAPTPPSPAQAYPAQPAPQYGGQPTASPPTFATYNPAATASGKMANAQPRGPMPGFWVPKRRKVTPGRVVMAILAAVISLNVITSFIADAPLPPSSIDYPDGDHISAPELLSLDITNEALSDDSLTSGGVPLSSNLIATSYSALAGSSRVTVSGWEAEATLLGFDPTRDIAILGVDEDYGWTPVTTAEDVDGDSTPYYACSWQEYGYLVESISYATAAAIDFSGDGSETKVPDVWELLDVTLDPGCVLTNEYSEVTAMAIGPGASAFALPISEVTAAADNILAEEAEPATLHLGRPGYLGLDLSPKQEGEAGALVESVSDGPAAEAGLKAGDVLVSIDGDKFGELQDADNVVRMLKPGTQVKLSWTNAAGERKSASVEVQLSEFN
ncbi:MAG: PDZ domain-containing protein [Propionibacteriaceae bacterium]|nr:PDZ domain-containing protein [Propionibacteriaceae bacterium]